MDLNIIIGSDGCSALSSFAYLNYSFFKIFGYEIALLLIVITAVIGLSRHFVFTDMDEGS